MKLIPFIAFLTCVASATPAFAQAPVSLRTEVARNRVEVGESFEVRLSALIQSGGAAPSAPELRVPAGVRAQGPSLSSQTQMTISGGQVQQQMGITATWMVTATQVGKLRIGPASVVVSGRRVFDDPVVIEVAPAGQGGARRQSPSGGGSPFDPFDPFRGGRFPGFPNLFDFDRDQEPGLADTLPQLPEEFRIAKALDAQAFVRAVARPERAVVGEQVTLSVYAYSNGPLGISNATEPSRADFVAYNLLDDSNRNNAYQGAIGEQIWQAAKIHQLALFPIRAGTFRLGETRVWFQRIRRSQTSALRISEPVTVVVTEPPMSGRPRGYQLGDVGNYKLSATVEPRDAESGGSVSVVAKLEGTGNVPGRLFIPQQKGFSWSEPTVTDSVAPHSETVSGFRKFTYVVSVERAGNFELGALRLPYWDPNQKAYAEARAELGSITARPNPGVARTPDPARPDDLSALLKPRSDLRPLTKPDHPLTDARWFWTLLALGPLGVVVANGAQRLGLRVRAAVRARRETHETQAMQALASSRRASAQGDSAAAANEIERAMVLAIEGAVGLKVRAILRADLGAELERSGLSPPLAAEIVALWDACDALRFTGQNSRSSAPGLADRTLNDRAGGLIQRLRKHKSQRPS
ncbi:MAG TPA: BatD family protein [Polyangiaceae bacterium]